jgi:hypothetical protein
LTDETTRGGGGKGGAEKGANEKNEKKSNASFALKFWPQKNTTNTTEGKRREGEEEEDHHRRRRRAPNHHRVKRRSGVEEDASQIHTLLRKTRMGTTTRTGKDDGEIEDDFANSQMKPPRVREEDVPADKDDDVVGGDDDDENDDFENGKGTRGTVLLIDKDADRENH